MLGVDYLLILLIVSNRATTAVLGAAAERLWLWRPLWWIQLQGYLRYNLCRTDVERHTRPLGLSILVFDFRNTFRGQIGQMMRVSLGRKADICRNDSLR